MLCAEVEECEEIWVSLRRPFLEVCREWEDEDTLLHSPGRQRSPSDSSLSREKDSRETFMGTLSLLLVRDPLRHHEDSEPTVRVTAHSPGSAPHPPQLAKPSLQNDSTSRYTPGLSFAGGTVLTLASALGTVSGAPQGHGDMLITCPTTKDLNHTKDGFVILPSHDNNNPVLSCDWLAKDPHTPDCISRDNFSLVTFQPDRVVAKGPWDVVHRHGSYNLQLLPADEYLARTPCLIDQYDITSPLTTLIPEDTACDQSGTTVYVLSVLVAITCLLVIVYAVIFVWRRKQCNRRRAFRKPDTANGTPLCPSSKQSDGGVGRTEADMEKAGAGTH